MYEKHRDEFDELHRSLISLESRGEILKDTKFEEDKREVEYQILRKANNFLRD